MEGDPFGVVAGGPAGSVASPRHLPRYATSRTTRNLRGEHVSASSDESSSSADDRECDTSSARYERKKAMEKKFRHRYLLLQQAYEQRLQALAAQVRHVVAELQSDTTIEYLQQDPLTSEYANARVAEIIQECFLGEREKYIKMVSDQLAWQTNDLREAQQRIRTLQKKEKAVQHKWKLAQSELRQTQQQLEQRVHDLSSQQRDAIKYEESIRKLEDERDQLHLEVERLRRNTTALDALRVEHETFQVRVQNEREQERLATEKLKEETQQLREEREKLEVARHGAERDNHHLRQLLSIAETKSDELATSLRNVQAEEYSTRLLRMEHEVAQQRHANESLRTENDQLKKKYEDFGAQVELYMEEQARERAAGTKLGEERERKLADELATLRVQSTEALKMKQSELLRVADQVKFRQDAIVKSEQKISILEERVSSLEAALGDEKLRSAKIVSELEKEVAQWRVTAEKEAERVKHAEAAHAQTKTSYEQKLASMQEVFDQQQQQSLKEREIDARTRWQNEFVAQQEARIESLKHKYDSALEAQQAELSRARQIAVDAAKSAAEKVDEVKSLQQTQRVHDDEARRRRDEVRDAERLRAEAERAKDTALRKQQRELDERDKRLRELEQKLAESERREVARRATDEALAKEKAKPDKPNVVVLNVNGSEGLEEHEDKVGAQAITMVNRRQKKATVQSNRPAPRQEDNQEVDIHDACIPLAQHKAELGAREAQIALEAEKRLQKEMHEFQERKERELRNAMVNVRKGIQKLEASLESEKSDKKRFEDELFSERQAFVALKNEFDESREAKRTLTHRLEEANGNLGRLREIVKKAEQKVAASEERLNAALKAKVEAEQLAEKRRHEVGDLDKAAEELRDRQAALESELLTSKSMQQDMTRQLHSLKEELALREKQSAEEVQNLTARKAAELKQVSSELTARIRDLEHQVNERQGETKQLHEKIEGGAKSMEQLAADRGVIERDLESSKAELSKQRKAFSDLSRMHKNLTEAMNSKLREEHERYSRLQEELQAAQRGHEAIQRQNHTALALCLSRVQQLKKESRDLRKLCASEVKSTWRHAKKEVQTRVREIEAMVTRVIESERESSATVSEREREEWRARLHSKEQEMTTLLAGQKVDDQTKYNQLVDRLEAKSNELQAMERQATSQQKRIEELTIVIRKLEQENEARLHEQSQLTAELSTSRFITDRELESKQLLQSSVAKVTDVSHVFLNFVRHVMKEFALDPRKVLTVLDSDLKHPELWQADALSSDLKRVMELLRERMSTKEKSATDAAVKPLEAEISAARDALASLTTLQRNDLDDGVSVHLPWYVSVARSVKHQMEQLRVEATELRKRVDDKSAEGAEAQGMIDKLQQTHAVLQFEKETVVHELNLQLQTLQKRRDADLQQQKDEFDRRIEQLQRRHATDLVKAKEEQELAVDQTKEALETEKKALAKAKHDAMMARVEQEKLRVETQDRIVKLEKELEAVRDELAKWKRKAKLTAKSPGTPSRRPSSLFSSPFQATDDDASDASFQSMFPPSRRPSSAMADLSNLMEQSLHDLRKDNEVIMSPAKQGGPSLLMQSPMRRVSGTARPSPLRIPMHPSPARRRSSLVPPPRLISTVTSLPAELAPPST